MIIRKRKESTSYGRFFLATEAPGDEPKRNIKVINVKPDNRKRKDFTDYPDEDDDIETNNDAENLEDELEGDVTDEEIATDDSDYNADDESVNNEDDNLDVDSDTDNSRREDSEDPPTDDESIDDETTDGPAVDEEDYTGEGDDSELDEGEQDQDTGDDDTATDTNDDSSGENPGINYDSTRKYKLYGRFVSLYTATDNYISKLENNIYDDIETNRIVKKATDSMREVRDLLYDYMLIKFQASTYTQSMLFYSNMIASIQLIFKMISSVLKEETKK